MRKQPQSTIHFAHTRAVHSNSKRFQVNSSERKLWMANGKAFERAAAKIIRPHTVIIQNTVWNLDQKSKAIWLSSCVDQKCIKLDLNWPLFRWTIQVWRRHSSRKPPAATDLVIAYWIWTTCRLVLIISCLPPIFPAKSHHLYWILKRQPTFPSN